MATVKPVSLPDVFSADLRALDSQAEDFVPQVVDLILTQAREHRASDVHLIPMEHSMRMQWRIDGVLHSITAFEKQLGPRLVARLKILAGLLTYRTDLPQEGRISHLEHGSPTQGEVRVTTFPTLFGEKAAVRLFAGTDHLQRLHDLQLPDDVETSLRRLLSATSGVILLTGPSGSGKTTTVYACLRELVQMCGDARGLMSLEDPVEVVIDGVTQSQVRPNVGFDLSAGLKSMMRQDPDVIMVGEIRDPETAECAFQAALTGHLVLTTFHAGSSVEAVTRLLDMGIEPYLLRSTLQAVVCQRLLRRACPECAADTATVFENSAQSQRIADKDSIKTDRAQSCPRCGGLRYFGRMVIAELLDPERPEISDGILNRIDARRLQSVANDCGTVTLQQRAQQAVTDGQTWPEEVFRVLGSPAC